MRLPIRPHWLLVTGIFWLFAASVLGVVLFLGMIQGIPLPAPLRQLHVHGAMVGGVGQVILGSVLAFLPPLLAGGRTHSESHPVLFLTINMGTMLLLMALGLGHGVVIGGAGLLVLAAFLAVAGHGFGHARQSLHAPRLSLWFCGIAIVALFGGLGLGLGMGFRLLPASMLGPGRLAHIHLLLLGFVTLTFVGAMHQLFPVVLNAPLFSLRLARWTFALLPAGAAILVAGFLLSQIPIEIAGGAVFLIGGLLYAGNLLRTWLQAGRPESAASDHLLVATFFFVGSVVAGLLLAINYLWDPPLISFGRLHVIAYTHLALIGFILLTIMGALSHLLPANLAHVRLKSNKKRAPYLSELTAIMERWRGVQVGTVSLGTMGVMLTAALAWQLNLVSLPVQAAAWTSAVLLLIGMGLFVVKVVLVVARQPAD